jgi:4'-phosphopantetheinyl transferase
MTPLSWLTALPPLTVESASVCVFEWPTFLQHYPRFFSWLDAEETARASRFHFAKDRERFVVCHGVLRTLLGQVQGELPKALLFGQSDRQKPFLAHANAPHFNLSHSGDYGAIAIDRAHALGVDVEQYKPIEHAALAERFFAPSEAAAIAQPADARRRQQRFFALWSAKEAFIKAIGEGLSFPLKQAVFEFESDEFCSLSSLPTQHQQQWQSVALPALTDYSLALVVSRCVRKVSAVRLSASELEGIMNS